MDERQFKELIRKLDVLIKLTALNVVKGMKVKEQVKLLHSLGFPSKDIAWILGRSPSTVRVILHRLRKKGELEKEELLQPKASK